MKRAHPEGHSISDPRVLVISVAFMPCTEVGGKRFAYLSRYLSKCCDDYHVLARKEHPPVADETTLDGQVHRVRVYPDSSPGCVSSSRIRGFLRQAWVRCLCLIDPASGFVIPGTLKGIYLCKKFRLSTVIVTVPYFSSLIAATIVSKVTGARLIIDYRDPWTDHVTDYPKPFGRPLSRFFERAGIRQASAIVCCTEIMRDEFMRSFEDIAPRCVEVIYNGYEDDEDGPGGDVEAGPTTMLYAGTFYGRRRLSTIASVLATMHQAGEIDAKRFQWRIFSRLSCEDHSIIDRLGLKDLISIHEPVEYREIKKIMRASDILFLPSGDDVAYAVPFKFFDYLSVRRPILAVAPSKSSVATLMRQVDCGEHAEFGNEADIRKALGALIRKDRPYSYQGSQRFLWKNAASQYNRVIQSAASVSGASNLAAQSD